jgi:Flavin-binding monooxygenase-like
MESELSRRRRVLIIGAGGSGLTAIKCCLDEGLQPVCLEQTADLAGMWNYENCLKERDTRIASVMRSTIINTSKEMMCYSDFPIPADFPNYMHNTKLLQYFRMYADNFNLRRYIQFNTKVMLSTLSFKRFFNAKLYRQTMLSNVAGVIHVNSQICVCLFVHLMISIRKRIELFQTKLIVTIRITNRRHFKRSFVETASHIVSLCFLYPKLPKEFFE